MSEAVRLIYSNDMSRIVRISFDVVLNNRLIGLILVVIALGFFLNLRLSFWVSISIPISFAGMFIVIALVVLPNVGLWILVWMVTAIIITWPQFPKTIVPEFINAMREFMIRYRNLGEDK